LGKEISGGKVHRVRGKEFGHTASGKGLQGNGIFGTSKAPDVNTEWEKPEFVPTTAVSG